MVGVISCSSPHCYLSHKAVSSLTLLSLIRFPKVLYLGYIYWEAALPQGEGTYVTSTDHLKNVPDNSTEFTVCLENLFFKKTII